MKSFKKAFLNGQIFTVNPKEPWAEAILVFGNKIGFVGSTEKAKEYLDSTTEVIDLQGNLVLPGFIDSHAHIVLGGFYLMSVDLSEAKSKAEFVNILSKYICENKNEWITGGNWNHQNWTEKSLPRKEWIDEFSSGTPVFIMRMDYHMALANSLALKLAGITKNTPNPPGGFIERDKETGEPTGILKDKAMELVQKVIPEPTEERYADAIDSAMKEAAKFGVTSIHDITYQNHFTALQKAEKENRLTSRVYTRLPIEKYKALLDSEVQYNFGSDKLKIGSLKAFADGALGSSTAYFFDPYSDDPENYGLPMEILQTGELERMAIESDKNKLQLSIHAIGDRAISEVVDIAEKVEAVNPKWDRRFRIEHAQHMHDKDFLRMKKLNVIVSAQPYHLYADGDWMIEKIGFDRMKNTYAFKKFLRNDVKLCFGSDWPVVTLNPVKGIYAAVTRHTAKNENSGGLFPEEKLTVEEAVKAYTIDAAYAAFQENTLGSIEIGKLADFVVLSKNIFQINKEDIKNIEILMSVVDGQIIFEK